MEETVSTPNVQTEAAVPTDGAPETENIPEREQADDLKRESFEKLIRGEYKAEFDERVRKIIDKRFREMRSMKEQAARVKPVMDALYEKYKETDAEKLIDLLNAERRLPERENHAEKMRGMRAIGTMFKWRTDAEAIGRTREDFDLKREMASDVFKGLLRAGVDLKTAYGFVHQREILESAVRLAAEKAHENAVREMRGRLLRPSENGAGGYAGGGMKPVSVQNMTRAEREEIEKRASRGEKVYFS